MGHKIRILSHLPPDTLLANLRAAGRKLPAGDYHALLAQSGLGELRVVIHPPSFRFWWRHRRRTAFRPLCVGYVALMPVGSQVTAIIRRRRDLMTLPALWVSVTLAFWVWQRHPLFLWLAGISFFFLASSAFVIYSGLWSARQTLEVRALEAVLRVIATGKEPVVERAT
jgi:hypothetical protein